MDKWKIMIVAFVVAVVCGVLYSVKYNKVQEQYDTAMSNIKAYEDIVSGKYDENRQLQLTIDQLQSSKDSLIKCMDSVRNAIGVSDKNLKQVHYISSTVHKTDTLQFRDTIFNGIVDLDTIIGDAWYSMELKMRHPNYVIVRPTFKSSKYVTVYTRKETINPPKKCWLLRLFQKKHKVTVVDITEESPYVNDDDSRHIEIVK